MKLFNPVKVVIFEVALCYVLISFIVASVPVLPNSKFDYVRGPRIRNVHNQYNNDLELEHDESYNSKNVHSGEYDIDKEFDHGIKNGYGRNSRDTDHEHDHLSKFRGDSFNGYKKDYKPKHILESGNEFSRNHDWEHNLE
ncbi:8238_t:CDS:2, partial [Cetraspora pellucida]